MIFFYADDIKSGVDVCLGKIQSWWNVSTKPKGIKLNIASHVVGFCFQQPVINIKGIELTESVK